jgi:hypothetical protein
MIKIYEKNGCATHYFFVKWKKLDDPHEFFVKWKKIEMLFHQYDI